MTTTLTPQPKNSVALTTQAKHSVSLTNQLKTILSFLLKEDGFYLLLETGGKIILEPVGGYAPTNEIKH